MDRLALLAQRIGLLAIIGALVAGLAAWPHGYYQVLRVATCGTALLILLREQKYRGAMLPILAIAILYNPLLPIQLPKAVWAGINLASAASFAVYGLRRLR